MESICSMVLSVRFPFSLTVLPNYVTVHTIIIASYQPRDTRQQYYAAAPCLLRLPLVSPSIDKILKG